MTSIKLVVSNRAALTAKYGAAGVSAITRALKRLARADAKRGLRLKTCWLDRAGSLRGTGARAVAGAGDEKGAKAAIDALSRRWNPDYVMILGAPDVVPHQHLVNPVFDPNEEQGDLDKDVPSDLPYACDAPWAAEIAAFRAPTRVVGRLPDVAGARDPAYLVRLIDAAADAAPMPRVDYEGYFALTNDSWRRSTSLTLRRLYGNDSSMHRVPPEHPPWKRAQVRALAHFINCHGAEADDHFYGEEDKEVDPDQPVSLSTRDIARRIRPGTVAAMECCYGAQLFDAKKLNRGRPGLGNVYLGAGAWGYFGSTTVAYGPAAGNGSADLIARYFLKAVLGARSLGRATLEARQEFAAGGGDLDPVDLKTLGQFILLGDPSVQPVEKEKTEVPKALRRLIAPEAPTLQRKRRRDEARARKSSLVTVPVARPSRQPKDATARKLERLAAREVDSPHARRFETVAASGRALPGRQIHLVVGTQKGPKGGKRPVAFVVRHLQGKVAKVVVHYGKTFRRPPGTAG